MQQQRRQRSRIQAWVRPQSGARQRGTSLIEILVVLVILVFGILSIIRLFPGGFLAVRAAENSTYADRFAQATLEALKKDNAGLPDGIYVSYTDVNGATLFDPNVSPDDLGPYPGTTGKGNSNAALNPYSSDLNKARYISDETINVPAARTINNTFQSLYIVNFGPFFLKPGLTQTAAEFANYLTVNGLPWTAKTGDSRLQPAPPNPPNTPLDDPAEELTPGQPEYLADYQAGEIAIPPATYPQQFTLTVQVQTAGATPATTTYRLTLRVPASTGSASPAPNSTTNYDGGWISLTGTPGSSYIVSSQPGTLPANSASVQWVPGTATLVRQFRNIGDLGTNKFDADPYEYSLVSYPTGNNIGGNATYGNMGVIAFNPAGAGGNGNAPLKARISYTTFDWHILHEDHDISENGGSNTIRLTVTNLKKVGDVQFNDTIFSGLIPGAPLDSQFDIILLDTDTGNWMGLNTGGANVFNADDNSGTAANNQFDISYRNGRITLPANGLPAPLTGATHLRVFYAGDADWAVAVQKAPRLYTITNDLTAPTKSVATCAYDPANNLERIYFPLCDAGKTVEFDDVTYLDSVTGKTDQVGAVTATISDAADGTGLVYVDLPAALPNYAPDRNNAIRVVRGVSARAVVIWRERGQWKTRTVSTLLTTAP